MAAQQELLPEGQDIVFAKKTDYKMFALCDLATPQLWLVLGQNHQRTLQRWQPTWLVGRSVGRELQWTCQKGFDFSTRGD
jgi:hypothetical protein